MTHLLGGSKAWANQRNSDRRTNTMAFFVHTLPKGFMKMRTITKRLSFAAFALCLFSFGNIAKGQLLVTVAPGGPSGLPSEIVFTAPSLIPTAGGAGSGLVTGDAIDGFSQNKSDIQFLLCFSVDGLSVGGLVPVPGFPPFNVTTEATSGQAAGDAFLTTEAFDRASGILPAFPSMGLFNNVLAINQSPTYVADFGLLPFAGPGVVVPGTTPLDDVVGGGGAPSPPTPLGVVDLFFTLDSASTSLGGGAAPYLGGGGADVFFDPTADILGTPAPGDEFTFASAATLGLLAGDEMDALVVFNEGSAGLSTTWDTGDQILFSLAPGSPSLGILGFGPADVLSVSFGGLPGLFASAASLGLASTDNLDMLEIVPLLNTAQETIEAKLVPEPCTSALFALGGLFFVGRRKR